MTSITEDGTDDLYGVGRVRAAASSKCPVWSERALESGSGQADEARFADFETLFSPAVQRWVLRKRFSELSEVPWPIDFSLAIFRNFVLRQFCCIGRRTLPEASEALDLPSCLGRNGQAPS